MPDPGKIDSAFFDAVIRPNLGADREDVALGPKHGVDFGVIDVGGRALVTATDPLSVLPDLGFERAGRLALDVVLADVAVSGIAPSHLTVSLSLPPEMTDDELAATWRGMAGRAEALGVSVVTGHTARYATVDYSWVGGATVFGLGDHDDVVRPDGARPGDALVLTTGPAAEIAGLAAHLYPEALGLDAATVATARDRLTDIACVEDAMAAVDAGRVTAMHDATEGGIQGALVEMAHGADVRFEVDGDAVELAPGVAPVCDALGVDPRHVTSCGTLVIAVDPEDARSVVEAVEAAGTPAAIVGEVTDGEGVTVDEAAVEHPGVDPSWDAMAALADDASSGE
jgi:hydrogenase expression/formation protein HypE